MYKGPILEIGEDLDFGHKIAYGCNLFPKLSDYLANSGNFDKVWEFVFLLNVLNLTLN